RAPGPPAPGPGRARARPRPRRDAPGVAVPRDRPRQPIVERRRGLEAEVLERPGRVQPPAGLAVGLAVVPRELALVARERGDALGELADRDLLTRSEVDRVRTVVALRRQHDRLGAVVHIEALARGAARAPAG